MARRGGTASGEMGGGMRGGMRFIPTMATPRVRPEDGETAGRPGVRGGAEGIEGEVREARRRRRPCSAELGGDWYDREERWWRLVL